MSRQNISAFTGPEENYPPFVNLSKSDSGDYTITIRNKANEDGSCGEMAEITLTQDEFVVFMDVTNQHLADINA